MSVNEWVIIWCTNRSVQRENKYKNVSTLKKTIYLMMRRGRSLFDVYLSFADRFVLDSGRKEKRQRNRDEEVWSAMKCLHVFSIITKSNRSTTISIRLFLALFLLLLSPLVFFPLTFIHFCHLLPVMGFFFLFSFDPSAQTHFLLPHESEQLRIHSFFAHFQTFFLFSVESTESRD